MPYPKCALCARSVYSVRATLKQAKALGRLRALAGYWPTGAGNPYCGGTWVCHAAAKAFAVGHWRAQTPRRQRACIEQAEGWPI